MDLGALSFWEEIWEVVKIEVVGYCSVHKVVAIAEVFIHSPENETM
jgi:hypothetical protein